MKIPPGQRIFTTAYVHDGYKYCLLFLAANFDDAKEQCGRLGLCTNHELGTLEACGEITPDGPMTTWKADEEEGTVTA